MTMLVWQRRVRRLQKRFFDLPSALVLLACTVLGAALLMGLILSSAYGADMRSLSSPRELAAPSPYQWGAWVLTILWRNEVREFGRFGDDGQR
jgi:hypothetical protein